MKKTKEQLIKELVCLQTRISELEGVVAQYQRDQRVLKESEERFRSVFEGSLDSILLADPETGEILDANPASEELLLMSREEIIGLHQSEVHPPRLREYAKAAFLRIVNEAAHDLPVETVLQSSDGKEKPVEILAQVIQIDGRPTVYGVFRDISARKRDEQALRESTELLKKVFLSQLDAIFVLDSGDPPTIVDSNPAATKVFGYTREEMLGRTADFLHVTEKTRKEFQTRMYPAISERGFFYLPEFKMRAKDGTIFTTEHSVIPLLDEEGRRIGWVSHVRDITEFKRMEKELQKTQKLESLGILAGGIAHDFNNILTPVLANISMARTFGNFDHDVGEALADAEEACLRAKGLTQQLLVFSKGGMPLREVASISHLLIEEARLASSGSKVRWEYSIPEDLWRVEMDQSQMGQVIRNLIINADQAMPEGGNARIEATNVTLGPNESGSLKQGKYVKIDISDRGVGIPPRHLPKIFDPFFSTKDGGSGLGLSISHTIIKRHEGSIEVESEMGKGTTVHIYLPASERDMALEAKDRTETWRGKGRILLIDDDEAIRGSAQGILRRLGYEVESAKDGNEGLSVFLSAKEVGRPFLAVIVDLTIPGGTGGQATIKRVKEIEPAAKIIVSSGYYEDPVLARFWEYGCAGALPKPYSVQQLAQLVHEVVMGEHG